ncbi:hypothetical protein [Fimbriiglobus ruber]|uniref:Uncharacterized protein n=1 Tax=Fimbriiglobus ruber TaxID=1908690 RepID=A0A225DTY7_9BACT|nr:hypothetical protein [Fimbriiglobus ruber]OWK39835.1 hypothetical protein FRUB_05725 [Fimbriiglobus ruber]OWK40195.1 hypothetical protein FRUB_05114 [Fimbriiglobus ruber]
MSTADPRTSPEPDERTLIAQILARLLAKHWLRERDHEVIDRTATPHPTRHRQSAD